VDSRDLIKRLKQDGWTLDSITGSHHHFKHPTKPGKVTVPHPLKDMHPKTVKSALRQAKLV
jgi:predicted RNA binding protein YcfA (HicA-like mRNA interferase family)